MKTYKYRIYPTQEQAQQLEWTLWRCCELYNAALQERRDIWNVFKGHPNYYDLEWRKAHSPDYAISRYDQQNQIFPLKSIREEYKEITSHVLNDVVARVDKAFQSFFRRVKNGEKPGYPRFKSHRRYDSFTFPDRGGWKVEGKSLVLSKVGSIKIKLHRAIEGTIKTCSIKREGAQWYVCFACDRPQSIVYHPSEEMIGVDLGLLHFATLSTSETIENPRYYRQARKKLTKAQESLARKKRNSNRRKKAVRRVATAHRKIRNQRNDFLHKQSRRLVKTYGIIVFEDLSTKNLLRRPKPKQDEATGQFLPNGASAKAGLNTSIADAGWSQFVQYCQYKAEDAGATLLLVNPRDTSQVCSACLKKGAHKELSERTHTCTHCGVVLDRDHNAALNILARGRALKVSSVASRTQPTGSD